ncbi:SDR family oxidoreductase, partial [Deinococcus marmoris]|uniref:SDR family oxidoreductase n=1 Tax=Deinococcus marmoris TaxID=249408 RepID=UPI00096A8B08
ALVTGATNGIGKVTALELARQGYRVLLTSRDTAKGQQVLDEIRVQTGNDALEVYVGDLSSMADVRRIALAVLAEHPTLDVLVNNAGGLIDERRETVDGFEYTFAFNHLAYFLLTNLLLPGLKAAAQERGEARVVSVSSTANNNGRMRWDDLQYTSGYSTWPAYGQSKLMNVLFSNALARRLAGTGVTSNSLHPGLIASGFGSTATGLSKILLTVLKPFMLTVQQGAQNSLYVATSPQIKGISGQYFVKQKPGKPNALAADEGAQERLWKLSEELVEAWSSPVAADHVAPLV